MKKGDYDNTQNTHGRDALISGSLTSDNIKKLFSESGDIIYRGFLIKNRADLKMTIIYVDGMVNTKIIDDNIICPLSASHWYDQCATLAQAYALSLNGALDVSSLKSTKSTEEAVGAILAGKTILVFDTLKSAIIVDTIGFEKRSITPATEESTYRSSKDSFVETLRVNTATLRKKIKSHHLVLEETVVGKQSHTRLCIAYMKNICNDTFVDIIKKRLDAIDQDKALSISDIYSNVVKKKYTLFPTAVITEKPEACCMSLLEGKIAIIIDELPYSLVFPAVFGDFFQSSCDYGHNYIVASFFRILRYICFTLAIFLPGFFVSVTVFHPEMIPYKLAMSIASSRTGTPFSMYIEVLLMSLTFFILIQASLQISRTIGGAISIVGGLVLGEAAITAGIVSPAVIVVVATASICSMAIPNKEINSVLWLFQLICLVFSSVFGLIGIIITLLILFFSLAKLNPLGVPYIAPYGLKGPLQLEDSFIRFPQNLIKKRPFYLDPKNKRRKR
ncbi:MAG: spore germination protein [Eubacteriales bacterium]|nr:spore germination protein [Eubacteriales bacterium]